MYIIIAGCRKVGSNLALALAEQDHDVVVIDSDADNLEALGSGFNGIAIAGIPIDEDVLRNAGIEQADCLAAVTNDDNMNMMISQIARQIYHVPHVITRVYDPKREVVFRQMGLDTICPTSLAVNRIREFLLQSDASPNMETTEYNVQFTSVRPGRRVIGRPVSDYLDGSVFGLMRGNRFMLARPDLVIHANDILVVSD